jgi:DNA-binding XRE family transcriptional regulator
MQFGVICLTPENTSSPWVLFEAGALSKTVSESRVVPYLFGFEARELQGPLAQFQAVRADRAGTYQLIAAINAVAADRSVPQDVLAETFDLWWPRLEAELKEAAAVHHTQAPVVPSRSAEDMLGEVLTLLRGQRLASPKTDADIPDLLLTVPAALGALVRELRTERGLRQQDLARLAGISQPYISQLENGLMLPPSSILSSIAQVLGVTSDELIHRSRGVIVYPPQE